MIDNYLYNLEYYCLDNASRQEAEAQQKITESIAVNGFVYEANRYLKEIDLLLDNRRKHHPKANEPIYLDIECYSGTPSKGLSHDMYGEVIISQGRECIKNIQGYAVDIIDIFEHFDDTKPTHKSEKIIIDRPDHEPKSLRRQLHMKVHMKVHHKRPKIPCKDRRNFNSTPHWQRK